MEETIVQEPLVISKESGSKYDIPEIRQYIKIRKEQGYNFTEIAEGLKKERGFENISPNICSNLYMKMTSKSIVTHNTANEVVEDMTEHIKAMYLDALQLTGRLLKSYRKVVEETEDENLRREIHKLIPTGGQLMKSIREDLNTILRYKDTEIKEGQKQLYVTPSETLELVSKYDEELLSEKINPIANAIINEFKGKELTKEDLPKLKKVITKQLK